MGGGEKNMQKVWKMINNVYESIIFWKENLFLLPTVVEAKLYISEITDLYTAAPRMLTF